jgi:hypothetical protein
MSPAKPIGPPERVPDLVARWPNYRVNIGMNNAGYARAAAARARGSKATDCTQARRAGARRHRPVAVVRTDKTRRIIVDMMC